MRKFILIGVLCALSVVIACQKVDFGDSAEGARTVTIHTGTTTATRAAVPVSQISTRLSFAIFHGSERVRSTEHQEVNVDDDFGTYSIRLDEGTYTLVVIAHNGASNCTITSPEKVTFRNSHVTDTWCACTSFTVGSEDKDISVELQRVVARIVMTSTSNHTGDVSRMRFYYTGGSSTLNPTTMQGCVKSRQSETMDAATPDTYTLYTFPYMSDKSTLSMTVYAMDSQSNDLDETTFGGIPVEVRRTTNVNTSLFDKHLVNITVDDQSVEWGDDISVNL